jgi:Tfp pilus assembly protein PilN
MTQVNLLPADVRRRQETRRFTGLVITAGAIVVGLLIVVLFLQSSRLSKANQDLAQQQATNSALQTQIRGLAQFQQLKQQVSAERSLVMGLTSGQVKWSGALQDVSMVIPSQMYLTMMSGTLNQTEGSSSASPAPAAGAGLVGSVAFQGFATDQQSIAVWLTRLESVKGWVNAWVTSDTRTMDPSGRLVYQFSGSVDLTMDATAPARIR